MVYRSRKNEIILDNIACNVLPAKYFVVDISVSDNIFNVCKCTDSPPNPIKNEVIMILKNKDNSELAREVIPVVTSNNPYIIDLPVYISSFGKNVLLI